MNRSVMDIKSHSAVRIKKVIQAGLLTLGIVFLVAAAVVALQGVTDKLSSSNIGYPHQALLAPKPLPSLLAKVPVNTVNCPTVVVPDYDIAIPLATSGARPSSFGMIELANSWQQSRYSNLLAKDKLTQAARQRKHDYLALIKTDPTAALNSLIPDQELSMLTQLTNNCLETPVVIEGKVGRINADYFDTQQSVDTLILITGSKKLHLHLPKNVTLTDIGTNDSVRVTGYQLDNEILATAVTKVESAKQITPQSTIPIIVRDAEPPGGEPIQVIKTLVIMVNFADSYPLREWTDQVDNVVFTRVNSYLKEASYGKVMLKGSVRGPFELPMEETCWWLDEVAMQAMTAAKNEDPSLSFAAYDFLTIMAPFSFPSYCGWGGMATVGKMDFMTPDSVVPLAVQWINAWDVNDVMSLNYGTGVIAHEMGHGLGNVHARFMNCSSIGPTISIDPRCSIAEYGDPYDVLGDINSNTPGHFNAPHKFNIGWLQDGSTLTTITADGRYMIEPLETKPSLLGAASGRKALRIQRTPNDQIFIEYRRAIGSDAGIWLPDYNGAHLHLWSGVWSDGTDLIDTTPPSNVRTGTIRTGSTYIVPGSCRIEGDPSTCTTIKVVAQNQDALTVDIKLGREYLAPTIVINQPSNQSSVGGMVQINAAATDNVGLQKIDFYVDGNKKSSQTVLTCNPKTSCTATYRWDTRTVPNGSHTLGAKAYDPSGNEAMSLPINIMVANGKQWIPDGPSSVPAS